MFDSSRALDQSDLEVIRLTNNRAGLAVLNKRDLPAAISADDLRELGMKLPILPFSAIDLDEAATLRVELTRAITALIDPSAPAANDQIAISRERHRDALAMVLEALKNARTSALSLMPPEIVAVDIMAAAAALGSITGEVSGEDVLDAIFRDFCIGK